MSPQQRAAEADHARALVLLRRGDPIGARALLLAASARAPADVIIARDLADLLYADGEPAAALEVLPPTPATAPRRGLLLVALGRAAEAVAVFKSLGPLDQLPIDVRANAVAALAEAGAIDEALTLGHPLLSHPDREVAVAVRRSLVVAGQRAERWPLVLALTEPVVPTSEATFVFARVSALVATDQVAAAVGLADAACDHATACVQAAPLVQEALLARCDRFEEACAVLVDRVLPDPAAMAIRDQAYDFDGMIAAGRVQIPDRAAYEALCARPARHRYPLVLISAVRDEVDIIEGMLTWHFAQGVDAAIVIDNGSVDGTRARLGALSQRWPILVIDQPAGTYNQVLWLTRMVRVAGALLGAEWVIPADADELWLPRAGSLKTALERLTSGPMAGANQLQLATELVVPDRARGLAADFVPLAETLVVDRPLGDFGYQYAEAEKRLQPYLTQWRKCWLKVAETRLVGMGNHYALMTAPRIGYGADAVCRHYHTRSFRHLEAKVRRDVDAARNSDQHASQTITDQLTAFAAHAEAGAQAIYQRRTWPNPVYDHFLTVGRARHDPTVRDLLAAPPTMPALQPLPPAVLRDAAALVPEIDAVLPTLVT